MLLYADNDKESKKHLHEDFLGNKRSASFAKGRSKSITLASECNIQKVPELKIA